MGFEEGRYKRTHMFNNEHHWSQNEGDDHDSWDSNKRIGGGGEEQNTGHFANLLTTKTKHIIIMNIGKEQGTDRQKSKES